MARGTPSRRRFRFLRLHPVRTPEPEEPVIILLQDGKEIRVDANSVGVLITATIAAGEDEQRWPGNAYGAAHEYRPALGSLRSHDGQLES